MMAENDQTKGPEEQQKPKIIVDDDWKAQARAEKERLAREVEKQKEAAAAGAPGAGPAPAGAQAGGPEAAGGRRPRQLPPATFTTLVSSLVTQAFMYLGGSEDPQTRRRYVDLDLAKHHIDTLAMLEEKTKGNITEEERKLLDQGIYECRMQYVNIAQRVSPPPGA